MVEWLPLAGLVLAAGLAAGVLAGLLGVGGGVVLVPALDHAYLAVGIAPDVALHLAVGTSLALIVPTAVASSRAHRAAGAVDERVAALWRPPLALGSLLGAALAAAVPGTALAAVFAVFAAAAGLKMLLPLDGLRLREEVPAGAGWRLLPGGIGLVSALMGIGGGTLGVPILTLLGVPVHRAVGTAAWLGLWIALPAALGLAALGWGAAGLPPGSLGYVSLLSVVLLWPAGWIAAPWGARLAHGLPRRRLAGAFGVFLLLVAGRMAWRSLG